MASTKLLWRASLLACALAIVIGIYKSDHAREYIARQEWLPDEPPWASESFTNSQLIKFMGSLTNSSRSSATEALARLGSGMDIQQFQQWLSGAYYATFPHANDPSRVGLKLAQKGLSPKHPVIIVPGFVTSGLELWSGLQCFKGHFRGRLWTHYSMAKMFLSNRECWMLHLGLNFTSGLDPEGIRVRNAQGLDAVDFFFPGYDVWASVITSLADIGYDPHRMAALPYDWRLGLPNLERRDAYFTRLQNQVELFYKVYDERVLLVAHSWGDNVARAFLAWMEGHHPGWVDTHIAVHFNAAGPTLGVPKALTALLSGEVSETANLLGVASVIGEQLLGKEERTLVWRTWGSAIGMLPAGGTGVWGNATWAPDDGQMHGSIPTASGSVGAFLSVVEQMGDATAPPTPSAVNTPYDIEEAINELVLDAGPVFFEHLQNWGAATVPDTLPARMHVRFGPEIAAGKHWSLHSSVHNSTDPSITHGVVLGDGDGTVPLTSLGYMCASAWQTRELNPSGMKVFVREYADASNYAMPRGGPGSSAHVEVLRNQHFISDLLHAAAGRFEEIDENKIDSSILEVSALIDQNRKNQ